MCGIDQKCYARGEFEAKCVAPAPSLCSSNEDYCKSMASCLPKSEKCPVCAQADKPYWCGLLGGCVSSALSCTLPVDPVKDKSAVSGGISVMGAVGIALLVAGAVGGALFVHQRRQRSQMHEEVRSILSSYLPLEEADERLVTRQVGRAGASGAGSTSARVAPADAANGGDEMEMESNDRQRLNPNANGNGNGGSAV